MARKTEEPSYKLNKIIRHLQDISKILTEDAKHIRDNFNALCRDEELGRERSSLLLKYASPTARHDIGVKTKPKEFWHFLGDALKTKIAPLQSKFVAYRKFTLEQKQENLMTVVVCSRWDAHNFPLIMGFDLPEDIPPYGARIGKISTVPSFLAYMERSVGPVIVNTLADIQGITVVEVEKLLAQHEKKIIAERLPGLEVIRPVPAKAWSKLSLEMP
jgi:DNA-directed RNA polymerase subunit F